MECQKNFPAFASNNGIHLDNRTIREVGKKALKILVGAAYSAGFIHLKRVMCRRSGFISDLSGKVNVSGRKDTSMDVIINRLLREHDLGGIGNTNVVNGLPFF